MSSNLWSGQRIPIVMVSGPVNSGKTLFGLTIDPVRLAEIRHERRPGSKYASLRQCEDEVRQVEAMLRRHRVPHLNSTRMSVEEIATRIMMEKGLRGRKG